MWGDRLSRARRENQTAIKIAGAEPEPLDRLSDLFASDAILASQFFGLRKSAPSWRPLQRLMLAVLADGLDCLFNYSDAHAFTSRGRLCSEARAWIFNETATSPFSFAWICDGLGLDAGCLRVGIRGLAGKKRQLRERSKGG